MKAYVTHQHHQLHQMEYGFYVRQVCRFIKWLYIGDIVRHEISIQRCHNALPPNVR